jgi:hypothetical protein
MELEDQLDALLAIAFGTQAEADVGLAFMAEQDEPLSRFAPMQPNLSPKRSTTRTSNATTNRAGGKPIYLKGNEMNFNDWQIKLLAGSHSNPQNGSCVMEVVSYIAGEEYSDHPECACPLITTFAIAVNDRMDDAARQRLLPFVLRIAGSKSTNKIEQQRMYMLADYAVRVFAPMALESANLLAEAKTLKALPKIVDKETALQGNNAATATAANTAAAYANAAAYTAANTANAAADEAANTAAYANAAAYAAAAANAAVYAAANAAYANAIDRINSACLQCLDDMLKLTDDKAPAIKRNGAVLQKLQSA